MTTTLRLCSPNGWTPIIDWDGKDFTGVLSRLVKERVKFILSGSNLTLEVRSKNDGFGELIDAEKGLYNGCIGRLQRNESDLIAQLADYPFNGVNLNQGLIAFDSAIQFVTAYEVSSVKTLYLERQFGSFDRSIWAVCLACLFTIYSLLLIREHMKRKMLYKPRKTKRGKRVNENNLRRSHRNKYLFYEAVTHMSRCGSIEECDGISIKLIFISASLFASFIVNIISCSLSTDLVSIAPPSVYTSYSDLIENKVLLGFISGQGHYLPFKFAKPGSEAAKLWNISVSALREEDILDSNKADALFRNMIDLAMRKKILVIESILMPTYLSVACQVACSKNRVKRFFGPHVTTESNYILNVPILPVSYQDASERAEQKSFVFSKFFSGPGARSVYQRMSVYMSGGFALQMVKAATDVAETMVPMESDPTININKFEDCLKGRIYRPDVEWRPVTLDNVKGLGEYIMVTSLINVTVCFVEILVARFRVKRSTRRYNIHMINRS